MRGDFMNEYFSGKNVKYNMLSLKEQLNNKDIYFDSYEFDDPVYILSLIDKYELTIKYLKQNI